jgi:hypothetical protein
MSNKRIILRKTATAAGEFGASVFPVNIDVTGFTTKDLGTTAMKSSILYLLKNNGWTANSIGVSKSAQTANYYFISVVISAIRNTTDELERIKQGVGNVLSSVLPISGINASFAGNAAQTVQQNSTGISAFSFQIVSIGSAPLKDRHAAFNQLFVSSFPRLLYTNPSTSYTEAGLAGISYFGGQSQIAAVGETRLSPDQTKTKIKDLLRQAGVDAYQVGTINFDQKSIEQLQTGAKLIAPKNTADKKSVDSSGSSFESLIPSLPKGSFLDNLGTSLGVTTPIAIVAGAFLFVLITRR